MKRRHRYLLAGTAAIGMFTGPAAFAAPLNPLSFVYADQDTEQIVLSVDRNNDGDTNDAGENTTFFDVTNGSGLGLASSNVFAISQTSTRHVLIGDGNTDSVYRLLDINADGDANDANEGQTWFSGSGNASGFKLNTPNGIAEGPDGAIYIVEADTNGSPTGDWVYKTQDLNNDGDANDAGEAVQWLNLKAINTASSPFEIRFDGNTAYVMDTAGATADVIYKATDTDNNGVISSGEVTKFATEGQAFGANFDFAMDIDGDSILTWQWLQASGKSSVFRLTDLDNSGIIDQAAEVIEAWSTALLSPPYSVLAGFALAVDKATGQTLISSNGSTAGSDWIISLLDLNSDGDFMDDGEWNFVLDRFTNATYPARVRNLAFYDAPAAPVPLPAALPLLATALGGVGLLARRRARR